MLAKAITTIATQLYLPRGIIARPSCLFSGFYRQDIQRLALVSAAVFQPGLGRRFQFARLLMQLALPGLFQQMRLFCRLETKRIKGCHGQNHRSDGGQSHHPAQRRESPPYASHG